MGIQDEVRLFKQLTDNVKTAIDETYESIFTCEKNVDDLLKLAPCVFSEKEFFELLEVRQEFYFRDGRFERMATRLTSIPIIMDTMEVMQLQAIILTINESFDMLSHYVHQFNTRFQSDQFDIDKFIFLQKIQNQVEAQAYNAIIQNFGMDYDAVDYVELQQYIKDIHNMFFIVKVKDYLDIDFNEKYGSDTNVLSIKPFKTRVDANMYALRNGISRDYIFTRI